MKWTRLATLSLFASLAMCIAQAGFANVVVVDPNNMGNWVVFKKDVGIAEPKTAYAFADMAPGHSTIGTGAFYAKTGVGGVTSGQAAGQIWLGTDQYTGARLAYITKLQYTTYTYVCGAAPAPSNNDYCRQPIQLQLVIELTPGGDYGYLMHRPWGLTGQSDSNANLHMGFWETWDPISDNTPWYLAYSESSVGICGTWQEILMAHPDAVLATPPGAATNWDTPFTGTGVGLNFEVGARKKSNAIAFCLDPYNNWYKESEDFRGYVDRFTIEAIDYSDPGNPITVIPDTTYDFEGADPVTRTVSMNNRTAWDLSISLNRDENYMFSDQQFVPLQEHQGSFVRLFGKVLWDGYTQPGGPFYIDDGSGPARTVKIIAPGAYAFPDDYVVCTGTLKQVLWPDEDPPINYRTLTCRPEDVTLVFP